MNKDPVPSGFSSKVVYEFKCDRCPGRYMGETRRHLDTRIREHLHGVSVPSEISPHVRIAETVLTDLGLHRWKQDLLLNDKDSSVPLCFHL